MHFTGFLHIQATDLQSVTYDCAAVAQLPNRRAVCVCVCVCVRARACMRARTRVCVCVCVCVWGGATVKRAASELVF